MMWITKILKKSEHTMRLPYLRSSLSLISALLCGASFAQETALSPLSANDMVNMVAPHEVRIASFAKDESSKGSGALLVLLSRDAKNATVNLNGVRTELAALQYAGGFSCVDGGSYQQIFARDQLRLLMRIKFKVVQEACTFEGLISIKLDRYTKRYMVKGM